MPITVVLGTVRYQRCALVQNCAEKLKIELLFLPTYSPNLNLIERLLEVRQKAVPLRQVEIAGPLLLVDDVLDSGWTMTLGSALLRQAGSGPVYPFALATTTAK